MIIADLHIHGKYSRATSTQLTIPNLAKWARIKGVNLLGTGDFTHPKWAQEIKENLTEDDCGILRTDDGFCFMLQTEVSLVYSQDGKGRRVHNVILAPSLEVSSQITDYFLSKGRVDYDGRPIFKITCPEIVEDMRKISHDIEIIPAHIWTPWFSLFGSKSGFDSVKDAFLDQTEHIHALETGLSSDPAMNWRLSQLDGYQLVSFSDLHSFWPWRIGREATVFSTDMSYKSIISAIRTGEGLASTIEVDPNYGKYHYDGHRNCKICMSPAETKKFSGICPVCKKEMTIGVDYRVNELADRELGYKPKNAKPFYKLLPLSELIGLVLKKQPNSKQVWTEYNQLTAKYGDEYKILLDEQDFGAVDERIADAILKNRNGEIKVSPGYDGEYGVASLGDSMPNTNPSKKTDPKIFKKGTFV